MCLDDMIPDLPIEGSSIQRFAICRAIFETYMKWVTSGKTDIIMTFKIVNGEFLDLKLEWLLKVGEALKDEAFCQQVSKQQLILEAIER